jgi:hypothetical protein
MAKLPICGAVALLGAVCLPIAAADAATVTDSFSFTASGFTPSGSPVDPWTGSFTITYDPTLGKSGALDAFSSNLPAGYDTFVFVYAGPGSFLVIGDDCILGFGCRVSAGTETASLSFHPVMSGGLTFNGANLASTSGPSVFFARSGTVTPIPASTPLPAALPLFATGLGALGLLGWRRKRRARA